MWFKSRAARKIYWAVVAGNPSPKQGRISCFLLKQPSIDDGEQMVVVPDGTPGAQHSVTYYSTTDTAARRFAWVTLKPMTGRTHQLRVHMAKLGTPILGDPRYFRLDNWDEPEGLGKGLHLHARRITLPLRSGKLIDVSAPLPPHMMQTFAGLGFDPDRYDAQDEDPEGIMRLVIFDMDGTLIDSVAMIVETMTAAFAAVGEPVPTETAIRAISGITAREAMKLLAPSADAPRVEEILQSYRNQYARRTGGTREPLFAGARSAMERLRQADGTILAVATGKGHRGALALLTAHGILDWFHSVETPDHNRGKPDPEMIATAMAKAGASAGETVMIGDTSHDMKMAKAAGVAAIGVGWGYHLPADLIAAGADIVIDRFEDLDGAIDKLVG